MFKKLLAHMSANNLPLPNDPNLDGTIHRWCAEGTRKADEWYTGNILDSNHIWCTYGSWSGEQPQYRYRSWNDDCNIDPALLQKYHRQIKESEDQWKIEAVKNSEKVKELIASLNKINIHKYLQAKKIEMYVPFRGGDIIIPITFLQDDRKTQQSCQSINRDGQKRFYPGIPVSGGVYAFGAPDPKKRIILAEGFATAYSIWKATQEPTLCCFSANNVPKVAAILVKKEYTNILNAQDLGPAGDHIAADLDKKGIPSVKPEFKPEHTGHDYKDFNDMMVAYGDEAVSTAFKTRPLAINLIDLSTMDIPEDKFAIDNFLYQGDFCLVWATPGCGKTLFFYSLCACLHVGSPFLFINHNAPVKFFYLDAEQTLAQIKRRTTPIFATLQPATIDRDAYQPQNFKLIAKDMILKEQQEYLNLNKQHHINFINNEINHANPDVIIIDNYSASFPDWGLDHKERQGVWQIAFSFIQYHQQRKRVVILIHHADKAGDNFAGLNEMNRFADMELRMKKRSEFNPMIDFDLSFRKNRLDPQWCQPRRILFEKSGWTLGNINEKNPQKTF